MFKSILVKRLSKNLLWEDDESIARDAFEDELKQNVLEERQDKMRTKSIFGSNIMRSLVLDEEEDENGLHSTTCSMKSLLVFFMMSLVSVGVYHGIASLKTGVTNKSISKINNLHINSNYKVFPFNVTNSYFSDRSVTARPNEIPLLLHEFDDFGRRVLSDCYGLKRISLKDFYKTKKYKDATYSNNYYVSAKSLCDLMHLEPVTNKFRVVLFLSNPITYYMTQKKNIANSLTRSIVCRPQNEKLTNSDVTIAKKFLEDVCFVNMVSNHEQIMNKLVERYNWQVRSTNKCEQRYMDRYQKLKQSVRSNNLEKVVELNSMDLKLYFDFIRK